MDDGAVGELLVEHVALAPVGDEVPHEWPDEDRVVGEEERDMLRRVGLDDARTGHPTTLRRSAATQISPCSRSRPAKTSAQQVAQRRSGLASIRP